ncbi:Ig-like domain-containing protein [Pseudomonadota bacterium]
MKTYRKDKKMEATAMKQSRVGISHGKAIKQMLICGLAGLSGLLVVPAAIAADMCPAPLSSATNFSPAGKGGVSLDKTLHLLGNQDITGAAFDPKSGQLVFISEGTVSGETQVVMDDLVVAARAVLGFGRDYKGDSQDPSVSFSSHDWARTDVDGKMNVDLSGGLNNTVFGKAMYDADYILKKLGQGVDEHGILLSNYSELKCPRADGKPCLNYKSSAERVFDVGDNGIAAEDSDGDELVFQYWISPTKVDLDLFSAGDKLTDAKSFTFSRTLPNGVASGGGVSNDFVNSTSTDDIDVDMGVFYKIYAIKNGVQTLLIDKDGSTPDGVTATVPLQIKNAAAAFAANISDNYDAYADVTGFEALGMLKQLAKTVAILKWVRDNNISMDLSFMANYQPTTVVTDKYVKMLQLCKNSNGSIDAANSGPYVVGACNHRIVGGVDYSDVENNGEILPSTDEASLFDDIRTGLENNSNISTTDSDHRSTVSVTDSVTTNTKEFTAIALSAGTVKKDGAMAFGGYDLAAEYFGSSVGLARYYDSFSTRTSGFGVGWSELPYVLSFSRGRELLTIDADDASVCEELTTEVSEYVITQPWVTLKDYTAGASVDFSVAGWTWRDDCKFRLPYYLAPDSNDWIYRTVETEGSGAEVLYWIYEQRDSNNLVTNIAKFYYPDSSDFEAKPKYISKATSATDMQIMNRYVYDAFGKLISIYAGDDGNPLREISVFYNEDRIDSAVLSTSSGTRRVSYTYDTENRLDTITAPNGAVVDVDYQANIVLAVGDGGSVSSNMLAAVSVHNEELISINSAGINFENRVTTSTPEEDVNQKQTVAYDVKLNTVTTTIGNTGRSSVLSRDASNRINTIQLSGQDANGDDVSETAMDMDFNHIHELAGPSAIKNIRGNAVSYEYDGLGRVIEIKDAKLRSTTIEHGVDESGDAVVVITDRKGRKSAVVKDSYGRVKTIYRHLDSAVRSTIAAISTTDLNLAVSAKEDVYQRLNDLDSELSYEDSNGVNAIAAYKFVLTPKAGYVTRYNYDPATGKLISINNGDDVTEVSGRDSLGKVTSVTSPTGKSSSYKYDGFGRLESTQGPADLHPVSYRYNESGLEQDTLQSVSSILGKSTVQTDVLNRKRSVTDSRGVTTVHFYNKKGQLHKVVEISPDATTVLTTQYFYDIFGKLEKKVMPNGMEVIYGYNWLNQVSSMEEIEGSSVTNDKPVVTTQPGATESINLGDSFSITLAATDSNDDPLTYTLVSAPEGVLLTASDTVAGQTNLSWSPNADQTGDHYIVVQVDDGKGGLQNISISLSVDDAVASASDNCPDVPNPDQRDTDSDGVGNACDADLNNDDVVNFADLAMFKSVFGSDDKNADFNGDGIVDQADHAVLKGYFHKTN